MKDGGCGQGGCKGQVETADSGHDVRASDYECREGIQKDKANAGRSPMMNTLEAA